MRLFFPLALLFATAAVADHIPDRLIYAEESYGLGGTHILQPYFARYPDRHPAEILDTAFLEQLIGERADNYEGGTVFSTASLRGYIATFEITDGALRVQDLKVFVPTTENSDFDESFVSALDAYFPAPESRLLDWYTGILVLPNDDSECCWYMDIGSLRDSYVLLRIEQGLLTDEAEMTGEEYLRFKRKQFAAFRETEDYDLILDELRDEMDFWDIDGEEELEQFVFDHYSFDQYVMLVFDEARSP